MSGTRGKGVVHSPIWVRCRSMSRVGGRGGCSLGNFGFSFLPPLLLSRPLLPIMQLLQYCFQLCSLTIEHDLQLPSLRRPNHIIKLLSIRSLYTLFGFFVGLISNKYDSQCCSRLHVDLGLKRCDLSVSSKRLPDILRWSERRDVRYEDSYRRWWSSRVLVVLVLDLMECFSPRTSAKARHLPRIFWHRFWFALDDLAIESCNDLLSFPLSRNSRFRSILLRYTNLLKKSTHPSVSVLVGDRVVDDSEIATRWVFRT